MRNIFVLLFSLIIGSQTLYLKAEESIESNSSELIEIQCQGAKVLIFPKFEYTPDGTAINFVSTWGNSIPYVQVTDKKRSYTPSVFGDSTSSDFNFFGKIIVSNIEVQYLIIDGCYIDFPGRK